MLRDGMPSFTQILGAAAIFLSVTFSVFYVLWFFGYLPIDPELAVKIPVLILVLGFFAVVGWLGYVMVTVPVRRGRR